MFRYCAWEFPTNEAAAEAHQRLIDKSTGQPCSITRIIDLVVVICDNRSAWRFIKRQKIKNGWPVSLPDEVVEMFIERRKEIAPEGPDEMIRIQQTEDGTAIVWLQ